jgi:hypothetical protein
MSRDQLRKARGAGDPSPCSAKACIVLCGMAATVLPLSRPEFALDRLVLPGRPSVQYSTIESIDERTVLDRHANA